MPEKITALYARQSIDKKDSISIEGQIEFCKAEAGRDFKVYEDKGYSGKNTKRPAFERMMADVEDGHVSKLVCYRLDRISRSILDFGNIWDTLNRNGVEFVSVNEKFDTSTPVGRAMLYIIMVFAQLERETIAERVKDNYYQRVKKGAWPGGPAPYGLRISDKRINGTCTLAPTPELDIVKRIFDMYAITGMSLGKVAKQLTEDGVPCTKRASWDTVSVYRVLRHPAYVKADTDVYVYYKNKGMIIYNEPADFTGTNGGLIVGKRQSNERKYSDVTNHLFALSNHHGIINSAQFLTCQYKLDANKQIKNTGKGKLTWLSGLLHCADCGYSLRVQKDSGSGKLRFYCSGRSNYYCCDTLHPESVEDAESYAEYEIIQYIKSRMRTGHQPEATSNDQNELKLALYQVEEKISNLMKALADGSNITIKYINAEISRLEEEKNVLIQKLTEAAVSSPQTPLAIDFPSLSFEDKKLVAAMLIKTLICSPEGFKIEWK